MDEISEKIRDYWDLLSSEEKIIYNKIYNHVVNLGYRPGKEKKKSVSYNFVHKVVRNSI